MAWWTKHWEDIRPQLKYDGLKALFGSPLIAIAYWLIQRARRMPFDWYVVGAFVVLFIAFLLVSAKQRRAIIQPSTAIQGVDTPVELNVSAVTEFYRVSKGPFLDELEAHFQRLAVYHKDQKEREQFLVRALAAGGVSYLHDTTWYTIFRSQLEALNELNSRSAMLLEELKRFYDAAAAEHAKYYKDYTFDNWVSYMNAQALVRQDGPIVQITVRGKDFLKYLIQTGRSPDKKSY